MWDFNWGMFRVLLAYGALQLRGQYTHDAPLRSLCLYCHSRRNTVQASTFGAQKIKRRSA